MLEMVDPVVSALRFLQSDADNKGNISKIHYTALNQAVIDSGQPQIDYKGFVARWNDPEDPIHNFVGDFDGEQITLKTNQDMEKEMPEVPGTDVMDRTAKSATKRAENNPFET